MRQKRHGYFFDNLLELAYLFFIGSAVLLGSLELEGKNKELYDKISILLFIILMSSFLFIEWYYCILIIVLSGVLPWVMNKIIKDENIYKFSIYSLFFVSILMFLYFFISLNVNLMDHKVSEKDSKKILKEIVEDLLKEKKEIIVSRYNQVLMLSELGSQGRTVITMQYDAKYEDLTFEDLCGSILKNEDNNLNIEE